MEKLEQPEQLAEQLMDGLHELGIVEIDGAKTSIKLTSVGISITEALLLLLDRAGRIQLVSKTLAQPDFPFAADNIGEGL